VPRGIPHLAGSLVGYLHGYLGEMAEFPSYEGKCREPSPHVVDICHY
jgi:hypothetical protein